MTRLRVRVRLALLYALTFTAAIAAVLIAVYASLLTSASVPAQPPLPPGSTSAEPSPRPSGTAEAELLHHLLQAGVVALLLGAVAAVIIGWLVAGRMLTPVRRITATAAAIAAGNLHQRVALTGPDDEIKKLADTFDTMLARLEAAFTAQRRFTANASHELLTPLATSRTILEVAATDPHPCDVATLTRRLLEVNTRSEQLVAALLALAHAEQGTLTCEPVDLAAITHTALTEINVEADTRCIGLDADLRPAPLTGDPALLTHLVANLLRNAVRHNHPEGRVTVTVHPGTAVPDPGTAIRGATLTVVNTGPVVPPTQVERLFEPFVRGATRTRGPGHGLGLAIVHAVTTAHHGTVRAAANPDGGLTITTSLPAAPSVSCPSSRQ